MLIARQHYSTGSPVLFTLLYFTRLTT